MLSNELTIVTCTLLLLIIWQCFFNLCLFLGKKYVWSIQSYSPLKHAVHHLFYHNITCAMICFHFLSHNLVKNITLNDWMSMVLFLYFDDWKCNIVEKVLFFFNPLLIYFCFMKICHFHSLFLSVFQIINTLSWQMLSRSTEIDYI